VSSRNAEEVLQAEIAGRVRAEQELASERFLLRTLMDTIPDHIYFKDLQSRFVRINKAMAQWAGFALPEDAIGKTDFDLFSEEHAQQAYDDEQRIIRHGNPVLGKVEKETWPDGRITWVSTTKMPIRDREGKTVGTFGISRNITAQKVAEEERDRFAAHIAADLKMAREVQEAFLPHEYPVLPSGVRAKMSALQFSHRYLPTEDLAGDFFAILPLSDTKAGIFVCDVMGHGARAALVAAMLRGMVHEFRSIADDPGRFLSKINKALATDLKSTQTIFATACYLTIGVSDGKLRFASAGHPLPLWIRRHRGSVEHLPSPESDCGLALGLLEEVEYPIAELILSPGDGVLLYTDGLTEVEDGTGAMLGIDGVTKVVQERLNLNGSELLEQVLMESRRFSSTGAFSDDICMVGIDLKEH